MDGLEGRAAVVLAARPSPPTLAGSTHFPPTPAQTTPSIKSTVSWTRVALSGDALLAMLLARARRWCAVLRAAQSLPNGDIQRDGAKFDFSPLSCDRLATCRPRHTSRMTLQTVSERSGDAAWPALSSETT